MQMGALVLKTFRAAGQEADVFSPLVLNHMGGAKEAFWLSDVGLKPTEKAKSKK